MKFTAKLLLVLLFIPLFLTTLTTATLKYQILKPKFWIATFEANNVYSNLAAAVKDLADKQTLEGGGSVAESRVLTGLLTPENLKDFLEKNITYLLDYANGKAEEAVVYIPIGKIPKSLLPANIGKLSETMNVETLLQKFNYQGIDKTQIEKASRIGQNTTQVFVFNIIVLTVILALLFILTGVGRHFIAPGLALLSSGLITLLLTGTGFVIRGSMLTDWVKGNEPSQIILATLAPHLLKELLTVWQWIGVFAVSAGVLLLFLRRPYGATRPKS